MSYIIGLTAALTALWFGLSGYFDKTLLIIFAVISVAATVALSGRMRIIDREGSPYPRFVQISLYLPWLMGEIFKANIRVLRACLASEVNINPALVKIRTRCQSDLARTIFANSITLTPGTVTVDIDGDMLLVHALFEDEAQPEDFEEMDRRVARAVDGIRERAE